MNATPHLPKTVNLPLPNGVTVCLPDQLNLMTPYVLLEQQDWFEDEIHFVRRLIAPGMAVLDIGANYGVYTLAIAKAAGAAGQVWAFEPASATADFLAQSLVENKFEQVALVRAALSDHEGTAHLSNNANAELNTLNGPAGGAGEAVRLTTLDAMLDEFSERDISFVKLDAEGEEPKVIAGGQQFFTRQSPLIMFEIKDAAGINLGPINQFAALGYGTYRLVRGLNLLVPFDATQPVDAYALNLFACKPDRASQLAQRGLLAHSAQLNSTLALPRHDLWFKWFADKPWAFGLLPQWSALQADSVDAGWVRHRDAINLYLLSQATDLPPAHRVALLANSFELLAPFASEAPNLLRLSTLARVAADWGQRGVAVAALNQIHALLQQGGTFHFTEAFLPAHARFDTLAAQANLGDWLLCGVAETLEQLGHYSSYFGHDRSRLLLQPVAGRAFFGEAAARRLELIKRLWGDVAI